MRTQEIKVLNIDGVEYQVESLSENAKRLVSILSAWRDKEIEKRDGLMLVQAAVRNLSQEIISTIRADNEKKAEDQAASEVAEDQAASVVSQ